jgi:hypothetical protein
MKQHTRLRISTIFEMRLRGTMDRSLELEGTDKAIEQLSRRPKAEGTNMYTEEEELLKRSEVEDMYVERRRVRIPIHRSVCRGLKECIDEVKEDFHVRTPTRHGGRE